MKGERVRLSPEDLRLALLTGMVEPDGVDDSGATVYRLTQQGAILTRITPERESKLN